MTDVEAKKEEKTEKKEEEKQTEDGEGVKILMDVFGKDLPAPNEAAKSDEKAGDKKSQATNKE